jgi:O-succinylbenzoic acid--CoA ligase
VARTLEEQRCTIASLVPSQLTALLEDPAWRPPSHLRAVLLGGAPASPALLEAAAARAVPFMVTYGMTEALGQVATADASRAGDPTARPRALPGVEIEGGTADSPARLRVRAAMLATCYVGAVGAREAIAPELVTGDLGHVDPDGTIRVVGRADDVIISGGAKVHPSTIEAVVAAGPGVRAACAFGVTDSRWGNVVGLAIATDPSFDAAASFARWHASLPPHARPRELAIADALPLLPTGKPDRRAAANLPRTAVTYG